MVLQGRLPALELAEELGHDLVDGRADDELGLSVPDGRLEVDDDEALGLARQVARWDHLHRRAQANGQATGLGLTALGNVLRYLVVALRELVVPIEELVAENAPAGIAPAPRGLEAHSAEVHGVRTHVLHAAALAPLHEQVSVQLAEALPLQAGAQVQPVNVLRHAVLRQARLDHARDGEVRKGRAGVVPARLVVRQAVALLLARPHAVGAAEVRDTRGGRDPCARVKHATPRLPHPLGELPHLGAHGLGGVRLLLRAAAALVTVRAQALRVA
mmetsp:Transcript_292/g.759  ORF Transcript_292/g.759 Transcript_292/m.759 type:complete len:273 (+) Transcript_292:577-1395(+)